MKRVLLSLLLLVGGLSVATADGQGKIHVVPFKKATITCDASKGNNAYPVWAKFPSTSTSVRKILMHVTLGCPDTIACAHWDYLDHVRLVKAGGASGKVLNYELSRMLTPYGSIFSKGWSFTWTVDVTDFAQVLRDSVLLEYNHSGYEAKTVGWALTIDFEITEGPQVIKPLSIAPLWNGGFKYGDASNPIKDQIKPVKYTVDGGSAISRIRLQHTGHGMDRPKGCSEFCSRWRDILHDGKVVEHRNLWMDCGSNPLYPQGGTWIYDRAWWCPGHLQPADIVDVAVKPGESHTIDMNLEPYTATGNVQAVESIASYLIQYSAPLSKNDVAIEEIMVPNNKANFNRMNPACTNPQIRIRNLGAKSLRTLDITYFTVGLKPRTYKWKGNLAFNQSEVVTLPGEIAEVGAKNQFSVTLAKPNGARDAWEGDNKLVTEFDAPQHLPEKMVLKFLTNNVPTDNYLFVASIKGDTLLRYTPKNLKPRTLYTDTLYLPKGSYNLTLVDTTGDGLEFWYEPQSGYGYLHLLDMNGRMVKRFESDCGNGQFFSFRTSSEYRVDTTKNEYSFILFPRMTKDSIALDVHSDVAQRMEVVITADGVEIERHSYKKVKSGRFVYSVGYLPDGRYIMDVLMDGKSQFKRRFNKISKDED